MSKKFIILFFVYSLFSAADDLSSDVYEEITYMRQRDLLRYSMTKFINFDSTSVNFASNNPSVGLPGIPKAGSNTYETDKSFSPLVFKSQSNKMFELESDRKTLQTFAFSKGSEVPYTCSLTGEVKKLDGFLCNDLLFDDDNNLHVLCYNEEEHKKKQDKLTYKILAINVNSNADFWASEFVSSWFSNPSLKLLQNSDSEKPDSSKLILALFDKQSMDSDLAQNVKFSTLVFNKADGGKKEFAHATEIDVNKILGVPSKKISLINLMIRRDTALRAYLEIRTEESKTKDVQKVYQCNILASDSKDAVFDSCKDLFGEDVQTFFLKENDFVVIRLNGKLEFCSFALDVIQNCVDGQTQPSWTIEKIMIDDRLAVAMIKIRDSTIMFMRNYRNNHFTWHYPKKIIPKNCYLFSGFDETEKKDIMISFLDKGFSLNDITISTTLQISESSVVTSNDIDITLDDIKIMHFKVYLYNNEDPVDYLQGKYFTIVKNSNGQFKTKLGIGGTNLNFLPSSKQQIMHYNLFFNNLELKNELVHIYSFQNKIYMFYDKELISAVCDFDYIRGRASCAKTSELFQGLFYPSEILHVERVADYMVILYAKGENTIVLDTKTLQIMKFDVTDLRGAEDCKVNLHYLICKYTMTEPAIDTLRVFEITTAGYRELVIISKNIKELITQDLAERTNVDLIKISDFGPDPVRSSNVYVLFSYHFKETNVGVSVKRYKLAFGKNQAAKFIETLDTLTEDGNVKTGTKMTVLDNQLLFMDEGGALKLFCYDMDHYYNLFFPDNRQILKKIKLLSHNMIGYVYKKTGSQETFFVLYKIIKNAIKQTIRSEQLRDWDDNLSSIHLTMISANVVVVWISNGKGKADLLVYFEDGPMMIASSMNDPVSVNGKTFNINFLEDKTFHKASIKYLESPRFNLDKESKYELDEYLSIEGNLRDLQVSNEKVKLWKPLNEIKADVSLGPIGGKDAPIVLSQGKILVFETTKNNEYTVIQGDTKSTLVLPPEIGNRECADGALNQNAFFCFWQEGPLNKMIYAPFNGKAIVFDLSRGGFMSKIFRDDSIAIGVARVHESGQYLTIHQITKEKNSIATFYLGKKKLRADNVKITDYHISFQKEFLTVIVFDRIVNKLHIFHGDESLWIVPTLKKSFDLNEYGSFFRNVTCYDEKDPHTFRCFIYSDATFVDVKISKSATESISEFHWVVDVQKTYKSMLYDDTFETTFEMADSISPSMITIRSKYPTPGRNLIACYDQDSSSTYSYFSYMISDNFKVLLTDFNENGEYLIYYRAGSELKMKTLKVARYAVEVLDKAAVVDEVLTVKAVFDRGVSDEVKFEFYSTDSQKPANLTPSKGFLAYLLIFLIVIVSILIVISFVAMIYFLRAKKQAMVVNPPNQ